MKTKFLSIIALMLFSLLSFAGNITQFVAIGDYGVDSKVTKKIVKLIKQNRPDFIITQGDNNYPNGCKKTLDKNVGKHFHDYIGQYIGKYGPGSSQNRFFPTLGNHDWHALARCPEKGKLPYQYYFTTLGSNGRYYDFVRGSVHFFALDSDPHEPDGRKMYQSQYLWFRNKVKHSKAPFKVAYFHHAPYSSGFKNGDKTMRWDFKKLGIDVVISGHDHFYERVAKDGVLYIVNGIGGYAPLDKLYKKLPESKFFYNDKHGFVLIKAEKQKMDLSFINVDGKEIDSVSIKAKD